MFHSEENAVANLQLPPKNAIAYVTGQCCNHCIYTLHQHGITDVFMVNGHGSYLLNEDTKKWFDEFVRRTEMKIHYVRPHLDWMKKIKILS